MSLSLVVTVNWSTAASSVVVFVARLPSCPTSNDRETQLLRYEQPAGSMRGYSQLKVSIKCGAMS